MKKIRGLFVLALVLSMVLISAGTVFAAYGSSPFGQFQDAEAPVETTPIPHNLGPFGPAKDGVAGISVTKIGEGNTAAWAYSPSDKVLTITGLGVVKICYPTGRFSNVISTNSGLTATFKSGNATCFFASAPSVLTFIK